MNSKQFCLLLGKRVGMSRDKVHKVLSEAIKLGKELIKEGDYWRLPGLGKFYCANLEPTRYLNRFKIAEGKEVWHDLPARKRIRFKFSAYSSATAEINQEGQETSGDLLEMTEDQIDLNC